MPTAALRQITAKQDNQALRARLEAEAARVQISYKASVIDFMVMEGIQDFSELDYATRKSFEAYLEGQSGMKHIRHHLLAFDKLKQHALSQEFHILEDGKVARPRYENGILYLPYHPDPKVSAMFRNSTRKNEHVWDFSRNAPERMKRQVFDILHYELENSTSPEGRRVHLLGLRDLYDFCTEQWIEDIEAMELPQIQAFREIPSNRLTESKRPGIINFCRRALFLQAEEINWNAHVWYMERFHIQPERMDPANPVLSISFVEVTHRRNRELLKRYIRYGLGITNLSVGVIRGELIYLRSFLNDIQQPEDTDICSVTPAQMEAYFRVQRQRGVQAETYNKIVMSILHFFNHLRVRQLIGQIPFDADSLLQKTVLKHHNRSVAQEVTEEIFSKLYAFPETLRLMYLHLWGIGLRISEVCTLKGNAYYIQGDDAWIQVYQIKMRTYKRIPIPAALYKLMRVYLKKHHIKAGDYVFQNSKGGPYRSGTFRYNMLKYCERNDIQNGEHIPLYYRSRGPTGKENISKAREIGYFERMLKFTAVDARREEEKDVWELDKLEIEHRENPIKRVRTLNFTRISQDGIRQELKKGIYLNLQGEAIACVQKELTAARRLSRYLADRYPQVQSCRDLNREIIEEYLTYLKTEATGTKHYHADLNRLRSLLESTGQMCDYPNLIGLFLTRDIPPTPKAAFKTYSDAELKRLNREIVKLDAQTARLMIIHQMLGTRISDTLTLTPDCLSERNGEIIIRIRQMKTKPYEKPISAELAALIKKAIAYTKEKYGDTTYIFIDEKNPSRPMPYTTVQFRITDMIYKKELRDDNGEIFGFGIHIYRHYYGMKLTEMHLDDWTIAKLLGHSSVRNVKYYRKMSNQLLADETRKARQRLSAVILDNLDGWEAEYEQIRQDDRLQ